MSTKLSYTQALDLLQMAVEAKGADYRYVRPHFPEKSLSTCAYYDAAGQPSCLVGQVMFGIGVILDPHDGLNFEDFGTVFDHMKIKVDGRTWTLLEHIQHAQDSGTPWGEALQLGVMASTLEFCAEETKELTHVG